MNKIALIGAGGKMGLRLATNLKETKYEVSHVEISPEGQDRFKQETGLSCVPREQAITAADAVILAVPDRLIGKVLAEFITELKPGTAIIMLDAAAPHAGTLPDRSDVTYFVAHPCHPLYSTMRQSQMPKKITLAASQPSSTLYARWHRAQRNITTCVNRSREVFIDPSCALTVALSNKWLS